MHKIHLRRKLKIGLLLFVLSLTFTNIVDSKEKNLSKLIRFKMATVSVVNIEEAERLYNKWLNYDAVERGNIPTELALSWGAEKTSGQPYVVMQPESGEDVYIRLIKINKPPKYNANTTWGWNAIEIICENPDELNKHFEKSPFKIIGEPAALKNYPSIRAMQVQGKEEDVIYFTTETGSYKKSPLPKPKSKIGRIFIMVVAGPDIFKLQDWYSEKFNLQKKKINNSPIALINRAQGIPLDSERPLTTLSLFEHGNLIELDGYGNNTGPRMHNIGELPPGISITSITVKNLDELELKYISSPINSYGSRSATVLGPAGELLELIEEIKK